MFNWQEKDRKFRPLLLHHNLADYDEGISKEENLSRVRAILERVIATGHGGVVTNVSQYNICSDKENYIVGDYLSNEEHWAFLQEVIKMCKELDLRVWIYDEKGYPSGGAGGVVVHDHPEYEAYGLVCLEFPVLKTHHLVVDLPRGHEKVVSAFAITLNEFSKDAVNEKIDLTEFVDEDGTLVWDSTIDGTVYYIVSKVLFEGTHAERNYHEHRRYPDVLDKKAIKYFIEVTYDKYKKYLGEYFGNTIEAVFTDEPSVMARVCYVLDREPWSILDVPDKKIPLYPHIVWSRNFAEEFKNRIGYDIMPYIPMLFKGDSLEARNIRRDYHTVVAELYEEAYFEALEEYCAENNVDFSGHLLGDDWLELHVLDELDGFKLLKHMHIPGIDMLDVIPEKIVNCPAVIKLASSVAHCYGKKWVMSESSGFTQRSEYDYDKLLGSISTQYASGINVFTSYFGYERLGVEEYAKAYDSASKMGQLLDGGMHKAPLMVYYPAEDCWQHNIPTGQVYSFYEFNPKFKNCCDSFEKAIKTFMQEKLDYDLVDRNTLENCSVSGGEIVNPQGEAYKALYVSAIDYENTKVKDSIAKLSGENALIYVESSPLTESEAFREFANSNNIIVVKNCEDAIKDIYNRNIHDIKVENDVNKGIIYIHKTIDDEERYMLVNTSENDADVEVTFKHSTVPTVYDVKNDKIITPEIKTNENTTTINLNFKKYQAMFVIF